MVNRVLDYIGTNPTAEIVGVGVTALIVAVVIAWLLDLFLARAEPEEEVSDVDACADPLSTSRRGVASELARRPAPDGVPRVRIFEPRRYDDRSARLRATVDSRQN
jgi:hypothetical protein